MDADAHQATADRTAVDVRPAAPRPLRSPAPETLRLYASDWTAFVTWCRLAGAAPLPAVPDTVAAYLAALAYQLSAGALARRAAAIAPQHGPHPLTLVANSRFEECSNQYRQKIGQVWGCSGSNWRRPRWHGPKAANSPPVSTFVAPELPHRREASCCSKNIPATTKFILLSTRQRN
jgi:hypothetical protein